MIAKMIMEMTRPFESGFTTSQKGSDCFYCSCQSRVRPRVRGVSPIIATILLVAITVVIAAVLYVMVSGYLSGSSSPPQNIELQDVGFSHTGSPATYYVTFSQVSASSGVTTADFGFKIINPLNHTPVAFVSATIISPSGVALAHFAPGSASWNNTITFPQGDQVSFDTGSQDLQGSGDVIDAFGLTSHSVSGGYSVGL